MNADPRLVAMRLAGNWAAKLEKDEITIDNAWGLLIERVGAIVPKFQTCRHPHWGTIKSGTEFSDQARPHHSCIKQKAAVDTRRLPRFMAKG
jgi:hypothetical protein